MRTKTRPTSALLNVTRLTLAFTLGFSGGCGNILKDLSTKNTNDAYYADAKSAIDARDYSLALTKLLATSAEFQAKRDVTLTIASAYAGRCGLDFLSVVRSIIDTPATRLLPLLVSNFKGSTTGRIEDCDQAQTWVRKLIPTNDFSTLTSDENLFLAVASLAKIGAILSTYADLDASGTADTSFDPCNTAKLPEARRRDIGVGLNLTLAALDASNNTKLTGSTAGVATTCAALPVGQNFCGVYEPAGFTAPMMQVLGGLIGSEDAVGLGTCANTLAQCICP